MNWQDGIVYADQVAKGEIQVCRNVLLAAQRFLNQIENKEWEWEFIPKAVDHFLRFASLLKHAKGADAGKPLVLEPFQIFLICAVYGFWYRPRLRPGRQAGRREGSAGRPGWRGGRSQVVHGGHAAPGGGHLAAEVVAGDGEGGEGGEGRGAGAPAGGQAAAEAVV